MMAEGNAKPQSIVFGRGWVLSDLRCVAGYPWSSRNETNLYKDLFSLHCCLFLVSAFMCAYALWSQKRALDALGLELEMIASCHMGAGNQAHVFWKSSF